MRNRRIKRLTAILLAAVLVFTFMTVNLSGCGANTGETTEENDKDKTPSQKPFVLTARNFDDYFVITKTANTMRVVGSTRYVIVNYSIRPANQFAYLDQLPPSITVKFRSSLSQFAGSYDSYAEETVTLTADKKYKASGEIEMRVNFQSTAAYWNVEILSVSETPLVDGTPITTSVPITIPTPMPDSEPIS